MIQLYNGVKTRLRRRAAYKALFQGGNASIVLADLRRFCHAIEPTADVSNERVTYLKEGRREVFLRIMAMCHITEDQLYAMTEEFIDENELG